MWFLDVLCVVMYKKFHFWATTDKILLWDAWFDSWFIDSYQAFFQIFFLMSYTFWFDSRFHESYHQWIDSNYLESYLWFCLDLVFACVNRFSIWWFVSIFIWVHLNRFIYMLICIILHYSDCLFSAVWIVSEFSHLVVFGQIFALSTIFYIYSYPRNTQTT